ESAQNVATASGAKVVVEAVAYEVDEVVKVAHAVVDGIEVAKENLAKQMSLVTKDVDLLTRVIRENIPQSIQESTDFIEATVKEVSKDVQTRFELMESKMKVSEIDLNIKFTEAEGNLGRKIDEDSIRLSNVEETLAGLLKAQQEQNETNKALTDFLVTNFLGDAKKGKSSG
ncbi:hypothetical protein Dimus_020479, partial [Dionaea muscipula]